MMNLNWIIELCAVLISAECVQSNDPLINVSPLCKSNLVVTCNASSGLYGYWTFYRSRNGSEDMENIGKVSDNERECEVTTLKTTQSTQCICIDANHVTCNIFDYMIAKPGHSWKCARHVHGSSLVSVSDVIPMEDINECTTTTQTATQIIKNESKMTESFENETSKVSTTEVMLTKTAGKENGITTEENEHKESPAKHDITHVSLMIAGSFVLFGLIESSIGSFPNALSKKRWCL
ncbi:hypothetical protein DPMN_030871 [Dreissena polymorpha]|uniref:Uncharacterized protein n=1 Tax=Dreissena polymorpha TaxID=45954 RepID=A0A9D4RGK3_DREPO|nr:hypothetical protein DPMN_030871 [Dreissena polymorpha]